MALQANIWNRRTQPMGQTAALNARLEGLPQLLANKNRAEEIKRQEELSQIQQRQWEKQHKLAKKAQKFQKKQQLYGMGVSALKAGYSLYNSGIADKTIGKSGWSPGGAGGGTLMGGGLGTLVGGKTGGLIGAGLGAAAGGFGSAIGGGIKKLFGFK